jgi:hypothetical protein
MIKRFGFVSNSSTTSFTCCVCEETEAFHDSSSYRDYGFLVCENGHEICEGCVLEGWEDFERDEDADFDIPETLCPVCQFQELSSQDAAKYLFKKYKVPKEEVFEHIKAINKRRKVLHDKEYVDFIFGKFNITKVSLLNEIKDKYTTYRRFINES